MTATPRLVWQAKDDAFRVVIIARNTVRRDSTVPVNSDEDLVLEERTDRDTLGRDVWQKVKNDGNPWLRAFYRLASDTGLTGGADIQAQVQALLEGGAS